MVKEAPQLNFTGFLGLFSDKMSGKFRVTAPFPPGFPDVQWETTN